MPLPKGVEEALRSVDRRDWERRRALARAKAAEILGVPVELVSISVEGGPRGGIGGGRPRRVSDEEIGRALIASKGKIREAARSLGVDESALRSRKKRNGSGRL